MARFSSAINGTTSKPAPQKEPETMTNPRQNVETIAVFRAALVAIVEAGRMSDEQRARYCAEIARRAIADRPASHGA